MLRSVSEPFLVGKVGQPKTQSKSERNAIDAPLVDDTIEALRRQHSRKPAQMREMIDLLLPQMFKCELFAREPWPDNDVWGSEQEKFAAELFAGET